MGKILNAEEGEHLVQKYVFEPLDIEDEFVETPIVQETQQPPTQQVKVEQVVDTKQTELIEQLLKKTDDLSNAISNLEAKITSQSQECNQRLAEVKETNYKAGFNEGYNQAKKELETQIQNHLSKLVESIHKIEEVYKEYQQKADNIEKELVGVAIDIAEQVIAKEVSKSSKEIALNLTKELLNDIKEATKIEIKLNPLDYDFIKENLKLENVKLTPDNAVSKGGVIILSDVGNIEAEIYERFKNVKEHLLKG